MIGLVAGLTNRVGGYCVHEEIYGEYKTIRVNAPMSCMILCSDPDKVTIEVDSTSSTLQISKRENGYSVYDSANPKDLKYIIIKRNKTDPTPISIMTGRELIYSEYERSKVTLKLPAVFSKGRAVIFNGNLHILSGGNYNIHYKWNKINWQAITPVLPYKSNNSNILIYNNKIHVFSGAETGTANLHYEFDGTTWTRLPDIPSGYSFYNTACAIFNNEIHVLGVKPTGGNANLHFKWDGTSWTQVSTLPVNVSYGNAIAYKNELHLIGGGTTHYKWNGTTWTQVSTLPYIFNYGTVCLFNDEIHMLGGYSTDHGKKHYKWNGTSWTNASILPYELMFGFAIVYNNEIHILGSNDTATTQLHYRWDGVTWRNYVYAESFCLPKGARVNNEVIIKDTSNILVPYSEYGYLLEY